MLSVEHVQCSENNHDVSLVVYEQLGPKVTVKIVCFTNRSMYDWKSERDISFSKDQQNCSGFVSNVKSTNQLRP